jgi:NDP-sugar pyrophosphorylase family protein
MAVVFEHYVARWSASPFAGLADPPWRITERAEAVIPAAFPALGPDYEIADRVAVHRTATIEGGASVKGPAIIGPNCFVAASAYLRGGVFLDADCIIGPGAELKTSFMFAGSKLAHFNFVGDSILGGGVNLEAGSIVANYRNELEDKAIRIGFDGGVIETGVQKFGALLGDGVRIGANAVVAPGAILAPGSRLARMALLDQHPDA